MITATMGSSSVVFLLLALLLVNLGAALEVTPGSSCASLCLDSANGDGFNPDASSTNASDITCRDTDFSDQASGIKFQSCLECLQKSDKANETESDLHWYMYNLRYALSTCLFSYPNEPPNYVGSPCVLRGACEDLKPSIISDELDPDQRNTYGYCDASNGVFERKYGLCVSCLQSSQSSSAQTYLANFVVALQAGCEQRPEPGTVLGISESVFTSDRVNVTDPAEDIMNRPEGAGSNTLTTGAIVGIAVGAGLLFIGAIALFIVHYRRQKRLAKDEKTDYYERYSSTPDPFLPPEGSKMTDSLRSHSGQSNYAKETFITNGGYYDKAEEDMRSRKMAYNFDPRQRSRDPNTSVQTHMAYDPRAMARIEMTNPYGRNPSHPAAAHTRVSSEPAESYGLRTYHSSRDPGAITGLHAPPASHTHRATKSMAAPANIPPPPTYPPSQQPTVPSLVLPSVGKLRLPKKYSPPTVTTTEVAPSNNTQALPEITISKPVLSDEER